MQIGRGDLLGARLALAGVSVALFRPRGGELEFDGIQIDRGDTRLGAGLALAGVGVAL